MFWQTQIAAQEIAGRPMTAKQLFDAVRGGYVVHAAEVIECIIHASVKLEKHVGRDVFTLYGASGTHRLAVECTDADRLFAHWTGFKEGALAAARTKFVEAIRRADCL